MKFRLILACALVFGISGLANASSKDIKNAQDSFRKNQFNSALMPLIPVISDYSKVDAGTGILAGSVLVRNAELHRELSKLSISATVDYLKKLTKTKKGKEPSVFATLFYGEALLSQGDYKSAKKYFNQFLKKKVPEEYKEVARVKLGVVDWKLKQQNSAKAAWKKLGNSKSLLVRSELARVNAEFLGDDKQAKKVVDEIASEIKGQNNVSSRVLTNMISVYNEIKDYKSGMQVLAQHDIGSISYREDSKSGKFINFYDVNLLGDIAELYRGVASGLLETAGKDNRYKAIADLQQIDLDIIFGHSKNAAKTVRSMLSDQGLPAPIKKQVSIREGITAKGPKIWEKTVSDNSQDAMIVSKTLSTCVQASASCKTTNKRLEKIAENLKGTNAVMVNSSIGRYYLAEKKYSKAINFLEAARNKSLKNKIEANDPVLLVGLSDAYRHDNKYSESLEIYFEMSKEFPGVRQIQEAVQGVYAMEQRSAGDVKIF
ncbi:MAG: hypothetical protein OEZ47_11485 [Gammaproteobacteria bacterium]|nr:hypothetical protein [Gammaproteobacteria bacterium]